MIKVKRDGIAYEIPCCMGSAVFGKHRCTCKYVKVEKSEFEKFNDRLTKLENLLKSE